ncbi:MAG: hypothetical protein GX318_01495 [Clostridia bacterium]|nr:hypothetical protein [Clostridia bacterium]
MLVMPERYYPDYLENTGEQNRRTVRAPVKKKRNPRIYVFGLVLLCFALGLYYTSLSATITRQGYELKKIQGEIDTIHTENERLSFLMARLNSLEKVEETAIEAYGMSKPEDEDIIFLSIADPGSEAGAVGEDAQPKQGDEGPSGLENILTFSNLHKWVKGLF